MIQRLGKYEIRGELGRGGFGAVYKAFDPQVGRVVAIKVLNADGDQSLVARFHAEAATAGNLQHRNIVTIYEFGEDRGTQFLVMEYLEGMDLQKAMKQNSAMTLLEKMEIMSQAAQGLLCAHQHDIIHRDVKPANIMCLPGGLVKIMDFGIARLTRSADTRLTQTGYLLGTVHYMAPEQFEGGEVDAVSDIWAFGVVYYELLTGVHPFSGKDAPSTMYRVSTETPPPVSALLSGCHPGIDAVISRLLMKNPVKRYQSLEDVLFDTEPLMRELARAQVPELMKRARKLMDANDIDGAQGIIRRILELDSTNGQARAWREELRERSRRRTVRPKIDNLLRIAEAESEKRNYASAIAKIDSALRLDPMSTTLHNRLEVLRAQEAQMQQADKLLSEANRDLERDDLTAAFQHVNEAIKKDPNNAHASVLLDQVRKAIDVRQEQEKRKSGLKKAQGLMLMQSYDDALAILDELAKADPQGGEVQRLISEARSLKKVQEEQDLISAGIGSSREALKRGEYEKALQILQGLDRQSPGNAHILPLLAYAQEQTQIQRAAVRVEAFAAEALNARESGDFERSLGILQRALQEFPGNDRILRVQQSVQEAQRFENQRKALAGVLARAKVLSGTQELEQAERLLDSVSAEYPSNAELARAKQELQRQIQTRDDQRRREIQSGIQEVEQLLAKGQANHATQLLNRLTIHHPAEPSLLPLLERARTLEREEQERESVRKILQSSKELAARNEWAAASAVVAQGLREHPDSPELAAEATRLRDRQAIQDAILAIDREVARNDFARAISMAEVALRRYPAEPGITALLNQAREGREFQELFQSADQLFIAGSFEEARTIVATGLTRFQDNRQLLELAGRIDKASRRYGELSEAKRALRARQFDAAKQIVVSLLNHDPDDGAARTMLEEIRVRRQEFELREKYDQERSEYEALLRSRRYQEAVAKLEAMIRNFPEEIDLKEELQHTRRRLEEEAKSEDLSRAKKEAERLTSQGRFDEAIQKLETLAATAPEDLGITEELQRVTAARSLRTERLKFDVRVKELERLFKKGDAEAVRAGAQQLLNENEEPRARELLEWAKNSIAQAERIRERGSKAPASKGPWIAAATVIAVAAAAGLWWTSRKPDNLSVRSRQSARSTACATPALPLAVCCAAAS